MARQLSMAIFGAYFVPWIYFVCLSVEGCRETYTLPSGQIQSPDYPGKYHNTSSNGSDSGSVSSIVCVYLIRAPTGYRLTLNFLDFDLHNNTDCLVDYLEVREGDSETAPLLGDRYCGKLVKTQIRSFGNSMWVKFVSQGNSSHTYRGFQANYASGVYDDAYLLITSSANFIHRMDPATRTNYDIPINAAVRNPVAVDYDLVDDKIYWTEVIGDTGNAVRCARFDGSGVTTVITTGTGSVLEGLAVDPYSRLLFYVDSGKKEITMLSIKTWAHRTIISTDLNRPRAVAVDTDNGVVFWTDWGAPPKIERSNYDGSDRRIIVKFLILVINAIAFDSGSKRLFWADSGTHIVETSDTEGEDRRTLMGLDPAHIVFGMTFYKDTLYMTDMEIKNSIAVQTYLLRYELSTNNATIFGRSSYKLYDVYAVDQSSLIKGSNGCGSDYGGCSTICVPLPGRNRKCLPLDDSPTFIPIVAGSVGGGVGLLVIVVVVIVFCIKKRKNRKTPTPPVVTASKGKGENLYSGLSGPSPHLNVVGPRDRQSCRPPPAPSEAAEYCELDDVATTNSNCKERRLHSYIPPEDYLQPVAPRLSGPPPYPQLNRSGHQNPSAEVHRSISSLPLSNSRQNYF